MGYTPTGYPTGGSSSPGSTTQAGASATAASKKKDHQRQVADAQKSFEYMLIGWFGQGAANNKNLRALVNNASKNLIGPERFILMVANTPEFHQRFPGIFTPKGKLKMQVSQYMSLEQSYRSAAASADMTLSQKQIGMMMKNNVDAGTASKRFQALSIVKDNTETFNTFNDERKAQGKKALTQAQFVQFALGKQPAELYQEYDAWQTRETAKMAGISIFQGAHAQDALGITRAQQGYITSQAEILGGGKGPGGTDSPQDLGQRWAQLADDFQKVMPESGYENAGISKDDLINLRFGGDNAAQVAAKVEQVMANQSARAGNNVSADTTNLGQRGSAQRRGGA